MDDFVDEWEDYFLFLEARRTHTLDVGTVKSALKVWPEDVCEIAWDGRLSSERLQTVLDGLETDLEKLIANKVNNDLIRINLTLLELLFLSSILTRSSNKKM